MLTDKQKNDAINVGLAAAGGLAVSLLQNGMDKLNYFKGNNETQVSTIGALGAILAIFGKEDTKPTAYGIIGASSAQLTDEPIMNALSRVVPMGELEEYYEEYEDIPEDDIYMNSLSRVVPANGIDDEDEYGMAYSLIDESEFE